MNILLLGYLIVGVFFIFSIFLGYTLLNLLLPHRFSTSFDFSASEKILLSFLFGSATITWFSFVFLLLNIHLWPIIVFGLILLIISKIQFVEFYTSILSISLWKKLFPNLSKLILVFFTGWIVFEVFIRSNMISDGLYLWGFKARVIFEGGNIITAYFKNNVLVWSHLDYPLYLPILEGLIYKLLGSIFEPVVFIIVPIFYLLGGIFIFITLRRFFKFYLCYLLLTLYFFIPHLRNIAVLNYADIPLALYYNVSVVYFFLYLRFKKSSYKYLSIFAAANLFWIKKEGFILYVIYLLGFLIFNHIRGQKNYLFLLLSAIPCLFWYFFLFVNQVTSIDFVTPSYSFLINNINRFTEIPVYTRRLLKYPPHWGLFWPVLLVIMILRYRFIRDKSKVYLAYSVILPLIIYPCLFVFSTWQPYYEHVRTALDRLILQVFPTAFVFFAIIFTPDKYTDTISPKGINKSYEK